MDDGDTGGAPPPDRGGVPDEDAVAFAHRILDLVRAGSSEVLALVDAGVPVDLAGPAGDTLLMLAAYHGHAPLVAGLAARGADVDRCNDRGQAPIAGAVFKGADDVVDVLVAAGADVHAGDPSAVATARFLERADLEARLRAR